MDELHDLIVEAVFEAKQTHVGTDPGGFDAGHCMIKGLDGRTSAVKAMKEHPDVNVSSGGYHGTTADISGIGGQSTTKKGAAYWKFIRTMQEKGHLEGATVWSHPT